jgi:anthranilate 1,2-dioxygenase small subunit
MAVAADILAAVDHLNLRYIQALDDLSMEGWLNNFSPAADSAYVCISEENDRRGLPLALMLDDCRARLEDRVTFVTKIWAGTFQPYRTRHFVQRLACEVREDGLCQAVSNFSVTLIQEDGTARLLTTGVYQDVISLTEAGAFIKTRRAVYDANVLPQYFVYPI